MLSVTMVMDGHGIRAATSESPTSDPFHEDGLQGAMRASELTHSEVMATNPAIYDRAKRWGIVKFELPSFKKRKFHRARSPEKAVASATRASSSTCIGIVALGGAMDNES